MTKRAKNSSSNYDPHRTAIVTPGQEYTGYTSYVVSDPEELGFWVPSDQRPWSCHGLLYHRYKDKEVHGHVKVLVNDVFCGSIRNFHSLCDLVHLHTTILKNYLHAIDDFRSFFINDFLINDQRFSSPWKLWHPTVQCCRRRGILPIDFKHPRMNFLRLYAFLRYRFDYCSILNLRISHFIIRNQE